MLDIITRKRDGQCLSDADIHRFVTGLADGSLPGEQLAALAMAIYLRSMDGRETAALTAGMARSGQIIDWSTYALDGPLLAKHSTGGVGDKVSLMLAPIVAACGGYVPMIAGRGLGHTGGTVDKLGSIPGYQSSPGVERFQAVVADVGCAIVGQASDLGPADGRLHAIRHITATIESTPLIIASILSKGITVGSGGLVLDVKAGSGAFMATEADAYTLAGAIIATASEMGLPTRALITGMDAPLGGTAGNALEVAETISYLTGGERSPRLHEVVAALAVEMLLLGGIESDVAMAAARVERALSSGAAAERFARMVHALGGPVDLIERRDWHLRRAAVFRPVPAERSGYLAAVDVRAIGMAVIGLGGGRRRIDDLIDVSVGFSHVVPLGGQVEAGEPMAMVHAVREDEADRAIAAYRAACTIDTRSHLARPMIRAIIGRGT